MTGRLGRRTANGFTIVELIFVVAIIGILTAVAVPTYVNWRANALNREVVAELERSITQARQDAKRTAEDVTLTFTDGASTYLMDAAARELPNGATLGTASGSPESLTFTAVLAVQDPFGTLEVAVTTGRGAFERTSTVAIIPPLGKTSVVQ